MYGDRFVIPDVLKQACTEVAHQGHIGINKTLQVLQKQCWWPLMGNFVTKFVNNCRQCCLKDKKFRVSDGTYHWTSTTLPFDSQVRIHMDIAEAKGISNKYLLIIVDVHRGWPEVFITSNRKADTTKQCLRRVFATFGVPKTPVTDNASEFKDLQLTEWFHRIGCEGEFSRPYRQVSNGLAERMVQTAKKYPEDMVAQLWISSRLFAANII